MIEQPIHSFNSTSVIESFQSGASKNMVITPKVKSASKAVIQTDKVHFTD